LRASAITAFGPVIGHGIGCVPAVIVMIDLIPVPGINDHVITATIMAPIIPAVVVIIIVPVNTNSHYCKCCEIRRIIPVIIRRNIGYISRGIYILNDGC
jgi:hypothetical protein